MEEMDRLAEAGMPVTPDNLVISLYTHIIMPYHRALDLAREKRKGGGAIGTTGRGIGPCYEDKVGRGGIRVHDLLDPAVFSEKLARNLEEKDFILRNFFGEKPLDPAEIRDEYLAYGERLRPFAGNVSQQLQEADARGRNILFEGAQGTHLDIDHGTYPYVTSSNTVAGNACCGAGIGPTRIGMVVGIVKAYTTRVGGGPFPSELLDETGERIRKIGAEFGADYRPAPPVRLAGYGGRKQRRQAQRSRQPGNNQARCSYGDSGAKNRRFLHVPWLQARSCPCGTPCPGGRKNSSNISGEMKEFLWPPQSS